MSKNEKKRPQGHWIVVGTSSYLIVDGQTITADGGAGTVELSEHVGDCHLGNDSHLKV